MRTRYDGRGSQRNYNGFGIDFRRFEVRDSQQCGLGAR